MIRKLPSGMYRLYSRKTDPKTGKRRSLGTFRTRAEALQHERAIQRSLGRPSRDPSARASLIRIKLGPVSVDPPSLSPPSAA